MAALKYRLVVELGSDEDDEQRIAKFEQMKEEAGSVVNAMRDLLDLAIDQPESQS